MADKEFSLSDFALTPIERHSAVWMRLEQWASAKLQQLRSKNDGPLDDTQTARIRGHIEFLKAFIALGDEPPTDG